MDALFSVFFSILDQNARTSADVQITFSQRWPIMVEKMYSGERLRSMEDHYSNISLISRSLCASPRISVRGCVRPSVRPSLASSVDRSD